MSPAPHWSPLGPIRTQPIEAGRRNVSRPSCQRSVGVRRVITGGITEHHQLSVGFRRPPLQTCMQRANGAKSRGTIGPDQGTVWRSETHLTASPGLPFQGGSMGSQYRSSLESMIHYVLAALVQARAR